MNGSLFCCELVKLHADLPRKSTRRLTAPPEEIKSYPSFADVKQSSFAEGKDNFFNRPYFNVTGPLILMILNSK